MLFQLNTFRIKVLDVHTFWQLQNKSRLQASEDLAIWVYYPDKHNILTTTTAKPTILITPKGMRTMPIPAPSTDVMGSCVELKPVSLAGTVTVGKVPLYVALLCSALLTTELTRTGLERVGTRVRTEPGVYSKDGLRRLGLTVVRDIALGWRSWWLWRLWSCLGHSSAVTFTILQNIM